MNCPMKMLATTVSFSVLVSSVAFAAEPLYPSMNAACISYAELPAPHGFAYKLASDNQWQYVAHPGRLTLLKSANDTTAQVRIWKRLPTNSGEQVVENMRTYTVALTRTDDTDSCRAGARNFRIASGTDGWYVADADAGARGTTTAQSTSSTADTSRSEGAETAAKVFGGLVLLTLLFKALSGDSSSGSSPSKVSRDREEALEMQRQIDRNAADRARIDRLRADQAH